MSWAFDKNFTAFSVLKAFIKRHGIALKVLSIIALLVAAQFSKILTCLLAALTLTLFITLPLFEYYKNGDKLAFKIFALIFCFCSLLMSFVAVFAAFHLAF